APGCAQVAHRAVARRQHGLHFASPNGLSNLSRLSVFWLRLSIAIEHIKPGKPQQNGRDECIHLTLKKEAARPAGPNTLAHRARLDAFRNELNTERRCEALPIKPPPEVYPPSSKPYTCLREIMYPPHDKDVLATACGRVCMHRKKINISTVLAGQSLG